MTDQPFTGHIRAKVICVFLNGRRILVGDGFDPTKNEYFYVPLGGAVEFGETSEAALRREIMEEIGVEVQNPRLLGVLENLFTFDGQPGHEIVFVYKGELADKELYQLPQFEARESNLGKFNAIWVDLDAIGPDTPPIYPEGLLELLKRTIPNEK